MAMALVNGGIAAEAVKIPMAIHVPDVDSEAPGKDNRDGMVVVGAIFLFQPEIVKRQIRWGCQCLHKKRR
jgi:hypothetical protein